MKSLILILISLILVSCFEDMYTMTLTSETGSELFQPQDGCDNLSQTCSLTEVFELKDRHTAVDVLFVLDVSKSMRGNLNKVGRNLSSLLSHISQMNWQIGFTTADHGDHVFLNQSFSSARWDKYFGVDPYFGRLMNLELKGKPLDFYILNNNTENYEQIFIDTLTTNEGPQMCNLAPYCQGDHEQPLRVLQSSMLRPENQFFFREDSDLVSIIITNEDERTEDPDMATTAREVKDTFYQKFQNKDLYSFNILVKSEDQECLKKQSKNTQASYGARIAELAYITGGKNLSICKDDYELALQEISQLIKGRILSNIYLSEYPDPTSITISTMPFQQTQWELEGRHIKFTPSLSYKTTIEVNYTPLTVN